MVEIISSLGESLLKIVIVIGIALIVSQLNEIIDLLKNKNK